MESLAELEQQFKESIIFLKREGLLNSYINQLHSFHETGRPGIFTEILTIFFTQTEQVLAEIGAGVDRGLEVTSFSVETLFYRLKGGFESAGARILLDASEDLREAIESKDKERCISSLLKLKDEFNKLRPKLNALIELDVKIHHLRAAGVQAQSLQTLSTSANSSESS